MKKLLLALLLSMGMNAQGQTSEWTFHPLDMDICNYWINPNGCGGCSSCAEPFDSDLSVMDGLPFTWTTDWLLICPFPIDTTYVNNVLVIMGYLLQPQEAIYVSAPLFAYEELYIDSISLKFDATSDVHVYLRVNGGTETEVGTITPPDPYGYASIHDIGCIPAGYVEIRLRMGDSLGAIFHLGGVQIGVHACDVGVEQFVQQEAEISVSADGIVVGTKSPQNVRIYDEMGRLVFQGHMMGRNTIPFIGHFAIVKVGEITKKLIF